MVLNPIDKNTNIVTNSQEKPGFFDKLLKPITSALQVIFGDKENKDANYHFDREDFEKLTDNTLQMFWLPELD
ncbi:MAG: hypothetical protein K940chlam6_00190 [Chlamydiae bacterium]|nr:hypothetical protein [Chlamydiota bacterium]